MIAKAEPVSAIADIAKWLAILFLLTLGVVGYYYFDFYPLYIRVLGGIVLLGISFYIAAKTTHGAKGYVFWQEAKIEILKVVWPTREETTKLTMLVLVVVVVLSLLLWLFDAVLAKVITLLIGW